MKRIVWSDEFSVGVEKMDVQHRRIITLFNKLLDNAQAHANSETVSEVLAEMVEYAFVHFKCEEQLLKEIDHPDLKQQKAEHKDFRRQAGRFCELALEHDEKVIHDLLNYLHDWWTDHILNEDKKYASFFKGKRSLSMGREKRD